MFFADPVTGAAHELIAPLIGVIVLVVLKADRIENQVIMDVVSVYAVSYTHLDVYKRQVNANLNFDIWRQFWGYGKLFLIIPASRKGCLAGAWWTA